MQEWYDLGPSGRLRNLPSNAINPDPFHHGTMASLRTIKPNGNSPNMVKIDLAHTYAISGWGKDELASSLILLSVHCNVFGTGPIDKKLDAAYADFQQWCVTNHKSSTIREFSLQELKMSSSLDLAIGIFTFWGILIPLVTFCITPHVPNTCRQSEAPIFPERPWQRL